MRRKVGFLALLALLAAFAGCGSEESLDGSHPDYEQALAGSPPPLAALHAQANELLPGGTDAFERRLGELRGYPVVVNLWASWCGPCRHEFPALQDLSARYGKRVGFLGVDTQDDEDAAATFLEEAPVPYPSYSDPDEDIKRSLEIAFGLPSTVYFDKQGELCHKKEGVYPDQAELAADVRRYALREECDTA